MYSLSKIIRSPAVLFESESVLYCLCKMRGVDLCEIFCDVKPDQYDRAIGESLTNLAFDAVEKIINVSLTFTCCENINHFEDGWTLSFLSIVYFSHSYHCV